MGMKRIGMPIALVTLSLVAGGTRTEAMEVTEIVLYDNLAIPVQPHLHGTDVLYQGFSQGTYRLYVLGTGTGTRTEARNNLLSYVDPLAFGGSHASWITYTSSGVINPIEEGTTTYKVEVLDVASKAVATIVSDTPYKEFLAMDGSSVVWTDYRHSTSTVFPEVYHRSVGGGGMTRLTEASSYKAHVAVDGNRVVWQDYRNAGANRTNADIYLYDPGSETEEAVCMNEAYQAQPDVSGGYVVWQDYRNAGADPENADIYVRDMTTGEETAVCTAPGYQANPGIAGTIVVWQDYRNVGPADSTNVDIYGYDLASKTEFAVTTRPGYQDVPSIHGLRVVWYDVADGALHMATLDPTGIAIPYRRNRGHADGRGIRDSFGYTAAGRRCTIGPNRRDAALPRPSHLFSRSGKVY